MEGCPSVIGLVSVLVRAQMLPLVRLRVAGAAAAPKIGPEFGEQRWPRLASAFEVNLANFGPVSTILGRILESFAPLPPRRRHTRHLRRQEAEAVIRG